MSREWPVSDRVAAFLAEETYDAPDSLHYDRRLSEMMGPSALDVDTGSLFIETFATRFGVDLADFDPERHFPPQGGVIPNEGVLRLAAGFVPAARQKLGDATEARMAEFEEITVASLVASAKAGRWVGSGRARCDRDAGYDPREVAAYAGGSLAACLVVLAGIAEVTVPGSVTSVILPHEDSSTNAAVALGTILPASVLVAVGAVRRHHGRKSDDD